MKKKRMKTKKLDLDKEKSSHVKPSQCDHYFRYVDHLTAFVKYECIYCGEIRHAG